MWDIDPQGQPQLMVSTQLPESITAVDGGYITNAGSPDIIVHTFTGKVRCCPCCYNLLIERDLGHPLWICESTVTVPSKGTVLPL